MIMVLNRLGIFVCFVQVVLLITIFFFRFRAEKIMYLICCVFCRILEQKHFLNYQL